MPIQEQSLDDRQAQISWLYQITVWFFWLTIIFAITYLLAYLWWRDLTTAAISLTLLGCSIELIISQRWLAQGRLVRSLVSISAGLLAISLATVFLQPELTPNAAIAPLIITVIVLPYADSRRLFWIILAGWCMIIAMSLASELIPPAPPAPEWFTRALRLSAMPAATAPLALLLWQLHRRLNLSIERLRATNRVLGESEARYRMLAEHSRDLIGLVDRDGALLYTSPSHQRVLGYPDDTLTHASTLFELVAANDRPALASAIEQAGSSATPQIVVIGLRKHAGDTIYAEVILSPIGDSAGTRTLYSARDITEREISQAARQRSEATFSALLNAMPDLILRVGSDGTLRDMKPPSSIAMPLDSDMSIGRPVQMFFPHSLAAQLQPRLMRACSTRQLQLWEYRYPDTDQPSEYEARIAAIDEREALVVIRDVTERKQAEAALRESEERYRRLVEVSPEPIAVHSDEILRYINPAGARLLGADDSAQLIGSPLLQFVQPDDHARIRAHIQRSRAPDRSVEMLEATFVRLDGAAIDVEVGSMPLLYDRQPAMQLVPRDITARKRAEAQRREIERNLREAQKLESLGVLAGGIAHDFNNLLTTILGNANLALLELPPDQAAHELVGQIERAAESAADLTRQMLAYAGKGRFVIDTFDLNQLIRDTTSLIRASIGKSVAITYDLAEAPAPIEADATQIRQVLMNLIINAAEAIGDHEGTIVLQTRCVPADMLPAQPWVVAGDLTAGEYVLLQVSDSGAGMDADTLARIFDPFFSTKFTGRGLGLAAVQGIIRSHNGGLQVQSVAGQGTTFTIALPCAPAAAPAAAGPADQPPTPVHAASTGTVLVVDDEDGVRRLLARILARLGYQVLMAEDGRAALTLFERYSPALRLVLLDLTMPRMGGEQVFAELHALRPDLPIVVMSGYTAEETAQRFLDSAPAGFLQKPFTTQAVRLLVGSLVRD